MTQQNEIFSGVPLSVQRNFELSKGVPPQIIAEMFAKIEAPAEIRAAFWGALAAKKVHLEHGKITKIQLEADGRTGIFLDDGRGGIWLYAPDEMLEGQYNALKDAFDRGLEVDVFWQMNNNGDLVVIYVTVFGTPPK